MYYFPVHYLNIAGELITSILRKLPHFSGKVDYSLEKGPITWEQQIQENPLLRGTGPILPKFYNEDYSKYEKGTI